MVECKRGERKHEIAEEHLAHPTGKPGLFLILISKAQAPVWEVCGKCHLTRHWNNCRGPLGWARRGWAGSTSTNSALRSVAEAILALANSPPRI